jgi:hypothetical protein
MDDNRKFLIKVANVKFTSKDSDGNILYEHTTKMALNESGDLQFPFAYHFENNKKLNDWCDYNCDKCMRGGYCPKLDK